MDEFYQNKRVIGWKFRPETRRTILTLEGGETCELPANRFVSQLPSGRLHFIISVFTFVAGSFLGFVLGDGFTRLANYLASHLISLFK